MKKYFNIVLLLFIITGCGGPGATVPEGLLPPQNIEVSMKTANIIEVKWVNPEYTEEYLTVLESKILPDGVFEQKSTMGSTLTSYEMQVGSNLIVDRTYVFRMKSITSSGESEYSNELKIEVKANSSLGPAVPAEDVEQM